jgi:ribosome modulation factor
MKSYPKYIALGREKRIALFSEGKSPAPKDICPTNEPTLRNAFFKGWNSLTAIQVEIEARMLKQKEQENG